MPSPDFINPLQNPIFIPILLRLSLVFLLGFLLIAFLKKFNWGEISSSNLGQRYFGWMILTPPYILGIFFGRIPGILMLGFFLFLAISEIALISKLPKAYKYSLFFLSLVSIIVASIWTQYFYSLPILYFTVATLVAIRKNDSKTGLFFSSLTLFSAIWIIFGLSHFVLLSQLSNKLDSTRLLITIIIFAVSLSDVGAFVLGKLFHKLKFFDQYKIADNISPNKTYIGVLGHITGAIIGILTFYIGFDKLLEIHHVFVLAVIIGIFGVAGGLTNSMFKRYFEVKDSSHFIPGLGGILDRVDSLVRTVVVLYYYLLFFL